MKPTPMTPEQIMASGYNSGDPDGLLEFAKNVVSTRDAQWQQMLTGQDAFAHICILPTKDAGPTKFFTAPSDPRGFPVYTAPKSAQPKAECWACNDTGVVTTSSNGSGLIEAPCLNCEEAAQPKAEPVNQMLLEALKDAYDCIDHWAGYASDYFRKKHNIDADLARIEAAIAAAEGDKK